MSPYQLLTLLLVVVLAALVEILLEHRRERAELAAVTEERDEWKRRAEGNWP